jgi:hypothetical protein
MRKTISLVIVLTLTFGVILASTTSAGSLMVFAQSIQTNSSSSPASSLHVTKIKITSPTRGQQVPVGKDLTVSGTSIDNATSNCQVSVIANKVRPYQPATSATGNGGAADYSKWNFVLASKYTTIKPGENRITAKYECVDNPNLTGFSSVNVTGVPASATTATNQSISSSPSSVVGANQTATEEQQPANNTEGSSAAKNATSATSSAANKTSAGASPAAGNASGAAQGQNNNSSNPLAKIPIIGKLFGAKY